MSDSKQVTVTKEPPQTEMQSYVFSTAQSFESAQRMATALSKSNLVPKEYHDNMPNALVALEVAQRIGASPLMVMQNLYIVHGRPSWSSQFVISAINTCGRFMPLQFDVTGSDDDKGCIAWALPRGVEITKAAYDIAQRDGLTLLEACKKAGIPLYESPRVNIKMAKDEGWHGKNGSKWKTMPDLMLRYRSASFFGRLYAPEILMGMKTEEESIELPALDITPTAAEEITAQIKAESEENKAAQEKQEEAPPAKEEDEVIPAFLRNQEEATYTILAPDGTVAAEELSLVAAASMLNAQRSGMKIQKTLDAFNAANADVIEAAKEAGLL